MRSCKAGAGALAWNDKGEKRMMSIYVSGPMTGKPGNNVAAFNAAARMLREAGHFVINPAELSPLFGSAKEIARSFRYKYGETTVDDLIIHGRWSRERR